MTVKSISANSNVNQVQAEPQPRYKARMVMATINVAAAIAPVLGYLSKPEQTSLSEVLFDVGAHSLRALTFLIPKPSQLLVRINAAVDFVRLGLIIKNSANGTTTFPGAINFGDSVIHGANLAVSHSIY